MKKKPVRVAPHHEREVAELRTDREPAIVYLRAAIESHGPRP